MYILRVWHLMEKQLAAVLAEDRQWLVVSLMASFAKSEEVDLAVAAVPKLSPTISVLLLLSLRRAFLFLLLLFLLLQQQQ